MRFCHRDVMTLSGEVHDPRRISVRPTRETMKKAWLEVSMLRWIGRHRIAVSRAYAVALLVLALVAEGTHGATLLEPVLMAIGTLLVGVAVIGRMWCALYIAGYKDGRLVTEGPYSLSRNPLYLFSLSGFVGLGLATGMFAMTLLIVVFMLVVYPPAVGREERVLARRFGAYFERYCMQTRRFLTVPWKYTEPDYYSVQPKQFRRAMADVVWFPAALGGVHLIKGLHALQIVRPLLRLP